jgi:hypothetical protein
MEDGKSSKEVAEKALKELESAFGGIIWPLLVMRVREYIAELEVGQRWRYYGDDVPPIDQEVLVKVKTLGDRSEDDRLWVTTASFSGAEWRSLDTWYDKVIAWCPMPGEPI